VPAAERLSDDVGSEVGRLAWPLAFESAVALGRLEDAEALTKLLADQPPGIISPYLRAQLARANGMLAAARHEHEGVEPSLVSAIEDFRGLGYPYWLARAQTDLAAWLIGQGRFGDAAPLLVEAGATLESLGASPALARTRDLGASLPAA
jgi:hypothetical protein